MCPGQVDKNKQVERLEEKLSLLPAAPGVYRFIGRAKHVLYVGKASSLRNRVRSYFHEGSSDTRAFIAPLRDEIVDFETFVVKSEKEATLLEHSLIQEDKPKYNVKLRDDKAYVSLRLDTRPDWPRLEIVRKPKPDGAKYFGPYNSSTSARETLRLINRHFQLRTCSDSEFRARKRPCLQYHIKRCPGPCVLPVDKSNYHDNVKNVVLFLGGRHDELADMLQHRMKAFAQAMRYEEAAVARNQLRAVEHVQEKQHVVTTSDVDQDVVGIFREGDLAELAVLHLRAGRLIGIETVSLNNASLPSDELLGGFISQYYAKTSQIPDEVIVHLSLEAQDGIAEVLSDERGKRVRVIHPQRGERSALLLLAKENAEHAYREKARARDDAMRRLKEIQDTLRLTALPKRIECLDISHSGGEDTVGSIVALTDAAPDRAKYRGFKLQKVSGGDDYGAMREVLTRRFQRHLKGHAGWEPPDLLVVDGGPGQLRIAAEVLLELNLREVPVVGLAKERDTLSGTVYDRVYLPGQKNPIVLREHSPALYVLALARDEAHRTSNRLREKQGKARTLTSVLDHVPGIGPKTRKKLLRAMGSLRAVREASIEALVEAGASQKQALAIFEQLRENAAER